MVNNRSLLISELFYSLQGESSFTGLPCVFIRLNGCNLRCKYCDTSYSYEEEGHCVEYSTLTDYVDQYPNAIVEITGGEPLLQDTIYPLIDRLIQKGRTVLIETNGSLSIKQISSDAVTIIDIKCPGSGFETSFFMENLAHIKNRVASNPHSTEIKFVLSDRLDYQWAKQFMSKHNLIDLAPVIFSAVRSTLQPKELGEWILSDQLPVRLQVQLHSFLWPKISRGV